MSENQIEELKAIWSRLNKKGRKAVLRKARELFNQQNGNAFRDMEGVSSVPSIQDTITNEILAQDGQKESSL